LPGLSIKKCGGQTMTKQKEKEAKTRPVQTARRKSIKN